MAVKTQAPQIINRIFRGHQSVFRAVEPVIKPRCQKSHGGTGSQYRQGVDFFRRHRAHGLIAGQKCARLGDVEIDLGETLGVAHPEDIEAVLEATAQVLPLSEATLHLHDTNGRALDSVDVAVKMGVRSFDSACGGLGGCPFAEGAQGNLATEKLIAHCDASGWRTGVDSAEVSSAVSLL